MIVLLKCQPNWIQQLNRINSGASGANDADAPLSVPRTDSLYEDPDSAHSKLPLDFDMKKMLEKVSRILFYFLINNYLVRIKVLKVNKFVFCFVN